MDLSEYLESINDDAVSVISLLVFLLYIKSRADNADGYSQYSTNNNIVEKPKKSPRQREEMSTGKLFSKGITSSSPSSPPAQAYQAPEEKATNAQNVLFRGKDINTTTASTNPSTTAVGNSSTTNSKNILYNREKDVTSSRDWHSSARIHNIERPSPQDMFRRPSG